MNERDNKDSWIFGPGDYDPDGKSASGSGVDGAFTPAWAIETDTTTRDEASSEPYVVSPSSAAVPSSGSPSFAQLQAPEPRSRPRRAVVIAGALAAALVVAVATASFAPKGSGAATSQSDRGEAAMSSEPGSWSTGDGTDPGEDPYDTASTSSEDGSTDPSASTSDSDDAHAQLEELADEGLAEVSLDGEDVAMIASKWDGITDPLQETESGGHVFSYADILSEHERLASGDNLGARIVLLRGSDYGKRRSSPDGQTIYVTFALDSFSDLGAAKAWCNKRFSLLSKTERANSCVATKLTS